MLNGCKAERRRFIAGKQGILAILIFCFFLGVCRYIAFRIPDAVFLPSGQSVVRRVPRHNAVVRTVRYRKGYCTLSL